MASYIYEAFKIWNHIKSISLYFFYGFYVYVAALLSCFVVHFELILQCCAV